MYKVIWLVRFRRDVPRDEVLRWWRGHHGDPDGCDHTVEGPDGHEGIVTAYVKDGHSTCVASYLGTNTDKGDQTDAPCFPSSDYVLTVVKPYVGARGPNDGGTVRSSGLTINCGTPCQSQSGGFTRNTTVTLTATPTGSWTFAGWKGADCSGNAPTCTVTINTDHEVTATFRP